MADSRTRAVGPIAYVRVLVWPLSLLAVLLIFRAPIADQFPRVKSFEVDPKTMKIAVALAIAESTGGPERTGGVPSIDSKQIITTAENARSARLGGAKVLWVDDNPDNNTYERQALSALGIEFVLATTTEEALRELKVQKFGAIISDFSRRDDPQGGYTLLANVAKISDHPPFVIYSGSSRAAFVAEAKSRGAFGETNRPRELFDLVVDALKAKA